MNEDTILNPFDLLNNRPQKKGGASKYNYKNFKNYSINLSADNSVRSSFNFIKSKKKSVP